jgi:hypothetical protein
MMYENPAGFSGNPCAGQNRYRDYRVGADDGLRERSVLTLRRLRRMASAIYVRHDGLPLHSTGLIWTTSEDLIDDVIQEAEQFTWEAAGFPQIKGTP